MGKVRVSSLFSVGARPPTRAAAEALPRIWVRWFRHRIRLLDVVTRRVDGTIGRSPTETDLAEPAGSGRTWPGGDSGVGRECVPPPGWPHRVRRRDGRVAPVRSERGATSTGRRAGVRCRTSGGNAPWALSEGNPKGRPRARAVARYRSCDDRTVLARGNDLAFAQMTGRQLINMILSPGRFMG